MRIVPWWSLFVAAIIVVRGCNRKPEEVQKISTPITSNGKERPTVPQQTKVEEIQNSRAEEENDKQQSEQDAAGPSAVPGEIPVDIDEESEEQELDEDELDPQAPESEKNDPAAETIVDDSPPVDINGLSAKIYDLLVVGVGAQGVAVAAQVVLQRYEPRYETIEPYSTLFIDKNPRLGHGYPYDGDALTKHHVLNIPAYAVDITNWCDPICEDSDFVDWYKKGGKRFGKVEIDKEKQFWYTPKRAIIGKYLEESFIKFKKELNKKLLNGRNVFTVESLAKTTATHISRDVVKGDKGDDVKVFVVKISTKQDGLDDYHQEIRARDVIVATGHWDRIRHPFENVKNYVKSPWPAWELLKRVPKGVHAVVLGTSLSGADTTLSIAGDCGKFVKKFGKVIYELTEKACTGFKIFMYSRSGKLPSVQGILSKTRLSNESHIIAKLDKKRLKGSVLYKSKMKLDEVFTLVLEELVHHHPDSKKYLKLTAEEYFAKLDEDTYTDPTDIKKRLEEDIKRAKKSFKKHQPIYPQNFWFDSRGWVFDDFAGYFLAEDHIRFWGSIVSSLLRVGLPMPLCNAEKLLALMEKGHLEVKSTEGCKFEPDETSTGVQLKCSGEEKPKATYHYLVDARGQDGLIGEDESLFTQSMISNELVYKHEILFSNEKVAEDYAQKHKDAYGNEITGKIYKAQGATIAPGAHQARPITLDFITETNGVIYPYLSGPYLFGDIPIPRNLRTVVVGANCVVRNILAHRHDKLGRPPGPGPKPPRYRTCEFYSR